MIIRRVPKWRQKHWFTLKRGFIFSLLRFFLKFQWKYRVQKVVAIGCFFQVMKTLQLVYQEIGEPGNSANSPKDTGSNNHDICSYPKKKCFRETKKSVLWYLKGPRLPPENQTRQYFWTKISPSWNNHAISDAKPDRLNRLILNRLNRLILNSSIALERAASC